MSDWKMRREEVEKLIAAYRKLRCLWDYRSNEYKLYDLKRQAWQKLGKIFGKEPNTIKRKIKCLRCAYGSEKRKVDNSYGTSQIYRPNLFYYKYLNFLDSIIISRKGTKFENFENTSNPIAEYNEKPIEGSLMEEEYATDAAAESPPSSPSPPQKTAESRFKVRKQQHRLPPHSKLDATVNTFPEVTKISEETIYTAFAKTVALQLRQLPPLDATSTMSDIHQILSKNIIKSLLLKSRRQSCRTNRETVVGHVNTNFSVQTDTSESRLYEESKHQPNKFEEDPMSY